METNFCWNIEKIENYELAKADNFKNWIIHHKLETNFSDGVERPKFCALTKNELIALDMYFYRPEEELIFMKRSEHTAFHNKFNKIGNTNTKGMKKGPLSAELREKLSKAQKGKHFGNKGNTGRTFSEETRKKMSESAKNRWNKELP